MLRAIFVDSFMFILSFFLRLILTLVVSTSVPKEFVYNVPSIDEDYPVFQSNKADPNQTRPSIISSYF